MQPPSESSDDLVRQKLRAHGAAEHVVLSGAEGLIAAWRRFVGEVEHGYPLGLEDYRNDLDLRSLIAVAGISASVAAEDERLIAVLAQGKRNVWSADVPDAFWVRGYPRNAAHGLLGDLKAEGIV